MHLTQGHSLLFFRRKILLLSLGLLLAAFCFSSLAESLAGRPVKVFSGNRLLLQSDGQTLYLVSLAGVQTPLPASRWGVAAKRHLSTLVLGRQVTVDSGRQLKDSNRLSGRVLLGGADINLRIIQAGLARYVPGELPAPLNAGYAAVEQQARQSARGIWSEPTSATRPRKRSLPGGPAPLLGR